MRELRAASLAVMVVSCLGACSSTESSKDAPPSAVPLPAPAAETLGTTSQALVSNTDPLRSLVVKDAAIVGLFPIARVFGALRATAVEPGELLDPSETNLAVFRRWWATFDRSTATTIGCDSPGIDPQGYGFSAKCPRSPEAHFFDGVDPLDPASTRRFVPVALINRFDLTPSSAETCGEYRILYSVAGGGARDEGYVMMAFAAPNPKPTLGLDGCLEIAKFWQALTDDPNPASRGSKLEAFYFTDTVVSPAIVRAQNLGLVRSNGTPALPGRPGQGEYNAQLVGSAQQEWHEREFRLRTECPTPSSCTLRFEHIPSPSNPAEELFNGTHAGAAAFRAEMKREVPRLARTSLTKIAMTTSPQFNQFESSPEAGVGAPSSDVRFKLFADVNIRNDIQTTLTAMGSALTVDNILDRATTQTCGGCHRRSNNVALGGGLTWPASNGFTHISRTGTLSPALTNVFLPRRKQILEEFINRRLEGAETLGYVCH